MWKNFWKTIRTYGETMGKYVSDGFYLLKWTIVLGRTAICIIVRLKNEIGTPPRTRSYPPKIAAGLMR